MKRILIIGDSFACPQTSNKNNIGWPELLKNDYEIINLAQAGASEYKIYKQLKSVNIEDFDNIITCHTSFFRIPIEKHPIYYNNELHKNCDLIFTDVENKKNKNKKMKTAYEFYKHFFWDEYFIFSNKLIFNEIYKLTSSNIHITFFDNFYTDDVVKFEQVFLSNHGHVNHLNTDGNLIIYDNIKKLL